MGNCSHKAITGKCSNSIQIMTCSGRVLELESPKHVRDIIYDFPGHGIFRKGDMSSPLSDQERLLSCQVYYLLPLGNELNCFDKEVLKEERSAGRISSGAALDLVEESATNGLSLEVLPSLENGVWRVKMVISTDELEKILSEEVNMEALVEKMRMVASSSTSFTPKRSKSSWGANWNWKPKLSNVFKLPVID